MDPGYIRYSLVEVNGLLLMTTRLTLYEYGYLWMTTRPTVYEYAPQ